MRFWRVIPVLTIATALTVGACAREGAEEGEETELTPADTAMMTPPPEPVDTMMMDTMEHDTMMMEGETAP